MADSAGRELAFNLEESIGEDLVEHSVGSEVLLRCRTAAELRDMLASIWGSTMCAW